MKDKLFIFAVIYAALDVMGILFVYGVEPIEKQTGQPFLEEVVGVFLTFPATLLFSAGNSLYLYVIVNTVFWTLLWACFLYLTRGVEK